MNTSIRKFVYFYGLFLAILSSPSLYAESSSAYKDLIGTWRSNSDAFGEKALSRLTWSPSLDEKFLKLEYTIGKNSAESTDFMFSGAAYYKEIDSESFIAFWADSNGDLLPIEATFKDSTLTSIWGEKGKKIGRTSYKLEGMNRLTVTDWIMEGESWRQFNSGSYTRLPEGGKSLSATQTIGGNKMEKISGIGGLFFRSKDTGHLAKWYADNFGIDQVPKDYDTEPWAQEAGPTVFAPFNKDTEYFGNKEQQWMVNFRVKNLDAMVKQLEAKGIKVEVDPEIYPNGRECKYNCVTATG